MFVPRCLGNLRKRLVPSEAQPQEAIQTNGVRLEVPKNGHDNGRQGTPTRSISICHKMVTDFFRLLGTNTANTTVVVHQKGVSTEIM